MFFFFQGIINFSRKEVLELHDKNLNEFIILHLENSRLILWIKIIRRKILSSQFLLRHSNMKSDWI